MKAAVRDRYGSPDVVHIVDIDRPTPAGDEVLIRVHAASVNRADLDGIRPRPGFVRLFIGLRAPRNHRVGCDVAGVIEAMGPSATRFRPGDQVFGDLYGFGQGSFAEYVSVPERAVEPIPAGLDLEAAATLPHSAVLALQGLRRRGGRTIGPADRVLIDGASGNVGPFAVQIAKAMGAEVTGVCSTDKMNLVRSLGADHVIDYATVDYTRSGERYDWILDTDSHHPIRAVRRALRPGGTYVTLGAPSLGVFLGSMVGPILSIGSGRWAGLMLWWRPFDRADVSTLKELVAAGKVKPAIDRRYALTDVAEALRHVDEGRARGKVVVSGAPDGAEVGP